MATTNKETTMTTTDLDLAIATISHGTWASFCAAMKAGYIPTLRVDDAAAPTEELKAATRLVIAACRKAGYRIYTP